MSFWRKIPVQYQAESAECGLACIAMILWFHGHRTDLGEMRHNWPISLKGMSLSQVMSIGNELGLACQALRISLPELRNLKLPCLLHWQTDHFVVLESVGRRSLTILDPAVGRRRVSWKDSSLAFTGVVLEVEPAAGFIRKSPPPSLRLSLFLKNTRSLASTFVTMLLLSAALQVFALISPLYLQLVIDGIVPGGDINLLNLAGAGFAALAIIIATTSAFRTWLNISITARLDYGWSAGVFQHLVHLPWSYFEKRRVGDIQSRFHSLRAVRDLVATTAVNSLIDAAMALTTVVVLFLYSPKLAVISLLSVLLYLLIRLALLPVSRSRILEYQVSNARAESFFLESLRGLLAIKNFNQESLREQAYQQHCGQSVSANAAVSGIAAWIELMRQLTLGLSHVVIIWIAASDVLNNTMSLGKLIAYVSYSGMFTSRASTLVNEAIKFRLIRVQLDRLADIISTEREDSRNSPRKRIIRSPMRGQIDVSDVSYRYGANESAVLSGLSIAIDAGEHVALTGPSGCGKSTLLKLMTGLLTPSSGRVAIDGRSLEEIGVSEYRRQIGIVMQHDHLLGGTLLSNITFFDAEPDMPHLDTCCDLAGLQDCISSLPMGLHTLAGDMGDALSGGQKQRVLLARALYHKPRILFLDEATSHFDPELESSTAAKLAALDITRVVIAHRRETVRHADRVITLGFSNQLSAAR